MSKIIINNHNDFEAFNGATIGESEWHTVSQDQINKFANSTLDHQWIHVDEEKSKSSPFGTTIAHGYLSLSLMPYLWNQIVLVNNVKIMVNYGIDKLKFGQAVKVNSEIKLIAKLKDISNIRGITKLWMNATVEIKGENKSAFTAVIIMLYHFK